MRLPIIHINVIQASDGQFQIRRIQSAADKQAKGTTS